MSDPEKEPETKRSARTYQQIARLEPSFACPSPLGGHDFAILQTWLEERDSVGFSCTFFADDNEWSIDLACHGKEWKCRMGAADCRPHQCPIFEGIQNVIAQIEAHERSQGPN